MLQSIIAVAKEKSIIAAATEKSKGKNVTKNVNENAKDKLWFAKACKSAKINLFSHTISFAKTRNQDTDFFAILFPFSSPTSIGLSNGT